jgi:ribosomal silencing factor RsfS
MDYGDVVAHVFTPQDRDFYDLSGYYAKAIQVRAACGAVEQAAAKAAGQQ